MERNTTTAEGLAQRLAQPSEVNWLAFRVVLYSIRVEVQSIEVNATKLEWWQQQWLHCLGNENHACHGDRGVQRRDELLEGQRQDRFFFDGPTVTTNSVASYRGFADAMLRWVGATYIPSMLGKDA